MKILVTCPPMLRAMDRFRAMFAGFGMEVVTPDVVQVMTEEELCALVPHYEGWIIGDDPATERVLTAGIAGRLKAAVKWGVGVDNVDYEACRRLGLPIANTPGMFGCEVADLAVGYVVALARQMLAIDRSIKAGGWPKPAGISLSGKTVALLGYGDIGRSIARRLSAADMRVIVYDPYYRPLETLPDVENAVWPARLGEADYVVLACSLTEANRGILSAGMLGLCREGVRIVNVARGPLVDETALAAALASGRVHSVALDVFVEEPLPAGSPLRVFGDRCVFGSHNASNTVEAVERTSVRSIQLLADFLGLKRR
jgi:D-3-phosphoglycerate dehydrogenase / 2-oxoglutarate reductase